MYQTFRYSFLITPPNTSLWTPVTCNSVCVSVSYGILLWSIVTGKQPYASKSVFFCPLFLYVLSSFSYLGLVLFLARRMVQEFICVTIPTVFLAVNCSVTCRPFSKQKARGLKGIYFIAFLARLTSSWMGNEQNNSNFTSKPLFGGFFVRLLFGAER